MYPTAAKVVSACAFAYLAWYVSDLIRPNLPEGTPALQLNKVNAVIAFILGWRVLGRRAGQGYVTALGIGWSTAAAITIAGLFTWAFVETLDRSIDLFYEGPVDAIESGVALMVDYGSYLLPGGVIPAFLIGATIVAIVTEWVSHRAN